MGQIISMINNKGGVGKTTLAINFAHAIANKGKKVLVVDVDSQCNATSNFFDVPDKDSLYEIFTDQADVNDCIHSTDYHRVHFLPNRYDTAAIEPTFARRSDYGWFLLKDKLRDFAQQHYDLTILDCPPNLGTFSLQAMICSDFVIVPVEAGSRYATEGLNRTVETIEDVATTEGIEHSGIFLRLVINKADRRTVISKVTIEKIQDLYGEKVFKTIVPVNTDIQQAELIGKTVIRHSAKSPGTKAFRQLSNELLELINDLD